MCRTPDDVKFFGRAKLGDPTAGMTDAEQAAYWRASRDRMAAQNMEQAAKLEQARKTLEPFAAIADIFDHPGGNRPPEGEIMQWEDHRVGARVLTVEMLRAARAALSLSRSDS